MHAYKFGALGGGLFTMFIGLFWAKESLGSALEHAFSVQATGPAPGLGGFYVGLLLTVAGAILVVVGASAFGSELARWERALKRHERAQEAPQQPQQAV